MVTYYAHQYHEPLFFFFFEKTNKHTQKRRNKVIAQKHITNYKQINLCKWPM